ncbi:MAG: sensor histidine kinase [Gemmatimonadota bacterium]
MADKPGSLRSRPRRLDRAEAKPPVASHAVWWTLEPQIEGIPAELRPLAAGMLARLFRDPGEAGVEAPRLPEGVGLEDAWRVVEVLRTAIHRADVRGAPPQVLRSLHERLDEEAAALSRAAVQGAIEENRQLLQDVSHDLRSPLHSILFLADTLFNEHSGTLNAVQKRQVGVLYTAAVTLVGLVNDLIDAARLGQGREISISDVSFSVEAALNDVESLLGPLAKHRGVKLLYHLETVGPRCGDRQLLARVLINLVSNALQATDPEGRVEIRVTEPRSGWLRLEVHDDGSGEDVEHLRELIQSGCGREGLVRQKKSWTHGLGLKISSRLVRTAGGSIEVDSCVGQGACFVVDLPFPRVRGS